MEILTFSQEEDILRLKTAKIIIKKRGINKSIHLFWQIARGRGWIVTQRKPNFEQGFVFSKQDAKTVTVNVVAFFFFFPNYPVSADTNRMNETKS